MSKKTNEKDKKMALQNEDGKREAGSVNSDLETRRPSKTGLGWLNARILINAHTAGDETADFCYYHRISGTIDLYEMLCKFLRHKKIVMARGMVNHSNI